MIFFLYWKKATVVFYADDSTLYTFASSVVLNKLLNKELQSIVKWVQQNQLVLDVS